LGIASSIVPTRVSHGAADIHCDTRAIAGALVALGADQPGDLGLRGRRHDDRL
jgi:hypothetical protein